jgi:LuxR family maltose regulon positive regulatory protein
MRFWARVIIAQNKPDEALKLLAWLLGVTETTGLMGSVIEILTLQALALELQGDTAGAMAKLERALSLAEPEGYIRLFIDEGPPMAVLLQRAASRGIAPHYVSQLLAAFPGSHLETQIVNHEPGDCPGAYHSSRNRQGTHQKYLQQIRRT